MTPLGGTGSGVCRVLSNAEAGATTRASATASARSVGRAIPLRRCSVIAFPPMRILERMRSAALWRERIEE
jgi:hypothetical protein